MLQNHSRPRVEPIRTTSIYGDDVSPPDSPRTADGRRLSSSPNISPITDAGSAHRLPSGRTSSVPLPRQASNGGTSAFISGWREKIAAAQAAGKDGKIKWDDYSGDPTDSEKGVETTTRPGSTQFDQYGSVTSISASPQPKSSLFGVTLKKTRKETSPALPREEWKGSSGRSPILPQIEQKQHPSKQFFPSPMQRRQKGGFRQAMGLKSTGAMTSSALSQTASPKQIQINTQPYANDVADESELETPTADTPIENRIIPPRGDSMGQDSSAPQRGATWAEGDQRPLPPIPRKSATEPVPRINEPIQRKALTPRTHSPEQEVVVESVPQTDFNPGQVSEAFARLGYDNEPISRFSATTVNTTIPEAPEELEEEPELPQPAESVLNRRRPIQTAGYLPRSQNPSRKPTPSERDLKSLPAQPAEETAVDRVTLLEAKISSLDKRKANIQTMIHELTNVIQPSSVAYDNATRQEIKKTVKSLQVECAAVAKEIHDTGLKLYRAKIKRDEAAFIEPTGLWVSRVTK